MTLSQHRYQHLSFPSRVYIVDSVISENQIRRTAREANYILNIVKITLKPMEEIFRDICDIHATPVRVWTTGSVSSLVNTYRSVLRRLQELWGMSYMERREALLPPIPEESRLRWYIITTFAYFRCPYDINIDQVFRIKKTLFCKRAEQETEH